jgi:hypothetical protein
LISTVYVYGKFPGAKFSSLSVFSTDFNQLLLLDILLKYIIAGNGSCGKDV